MDLFCGAGGLSYGFRQEGFPITAGIDLDDGCRHAFEANIQAPFLCEDIAQLRVETLAQLFRPGTRRVLMGCAPCQPYSPYNHKYRRRTDDPQWCLLAHFAQLAADLKPDIVSMENVPHLLTFQRGGPFRDFVARLEEAGYLVTFDKLYGPAYGLAQKRTRLVLVASQLGPMTLPIPTHVPAEYLTVDQVIGDLPPLAAGGVDAQDPLHRAHRLSPLNLARIQASRPGGTWKDWPAHLVAACHRRSTGQTFHAVYGRMAGHQPAPTLTTQFCCYGSGRFGHPTQDRALSLREGAMLQGFPRDYAFVPPEEAILFAALGRLIGNAVPVAMARAVARAVKAHLCMYP